MERQANFALVGALSVALLIGALVFIVWLAQFSFNERFDDYRINFRGPVSGLSKGGEVQFNGIKVGEITRIALDRNDPNLVVTDISVEEGTPVRVDSVATTASQGITGVKYVQITPGTASRPLLQTASRDDRPVIAAGRGRLEGFVQDASSLMRDGALALTRINLLLSEGNIRTISQSLTDVGAVTAELRERRQMFASLDSTFARLDRAAADLQATAASARRTLGGEKRGALADVGAAASDLRGAVAGVRQLITRVDGSFVQLSATTLPEMTAALGSIQEAAAALDNLTSDIRQDPRTALTRPTGREVEIPR
jgi:phospholipid/cholesterol/gamma-HCH transport system substrate-binding protein